METFFLNYAIIGWICSSVMSSYLYHSLDTFVFDPRKRKGVFVIVFVVVAVCWPLVLSMSVFYTLYRLFFTKGE